MKKELLENPEVVELLQEILVEHIKTLGMSTPISSTIEKIKENYKDKWSILSFNTGKVISILKENGKYSTSNFEGLYTFEENLKSGFSIYKIQSPDKIIFTVGEYVKSTIGSGGKIKSFTYTPKIINNFSVQFENGGSTNIRNLIKIPQPLYEILELKDTYNNYKSCYAKLENHFSIMPDSSQHELKDLLKLKTIEIVSVKRLSDNEIFRIGDKIKPTNLSGRDDVGFKSISEIKLEDNKLYLKTNYTYFDREINDIEKVKFLFTTEDDKDIYEGDIVFEVELDWNIRKGVVKNHKELINFGDTYYDNSDLPELKLFSTKNAAKEYLIMNKPCLSYNDIKSMGNFMTLNEIREKLGL